MPSRTFRVGGIVSDAIGDWFFGIAGVGINNYGTAQRTNTTTSRVQVGVGQTGYITKIGLKSLTTGANLVIPFYAATGSSNDPSAPSGLILLDQNSDFFVANNPNTVTVFDVMGMNAPASQYIGGRNGTALGGVTFSIQGIII